MLSQKNLSDFSCVPACAVVIFWLWLLWKSRQGGKPRRARQTPKPMHISYGWVQEKEKDRIL